MCWICSPARFIRNNFFELLFFFIIFRSINSIELNNFTHEKTSKKLRKRFKEKNKLDTKTKDKLSKGKQETWFEDDEEFVKQTNSIKSS